MSDTPPDVIAMAVTCYICGTTLHNDDPTIRHPLDFTDAARARGWTFVGPVAGKPRCPTCTNRGLS